MKGIFRDLVKFKKSGIDTNDLAIVVVCDGFDKMNTEFKQYLTQCNLFDQEMIKQKGFLEERKVKGDKLEWFGKSMDAL